MGKIARDLPQAQKRNFKLFNKSLEANTWRDVLINTAEGLIKNNPRAINKLADSEIMKGKKTPYLTKNKSSLRSPHQLSDGLFLEINLSANSIVRVVKRLLNSCGYKETDIKIYLKD
jgi:archaellum component FlaG (FlaF/FlaG flagellin family)